MSFPERLLPSNEKKILNVNEKFSDNQILARYHDINDGGSIFKGKHIDTSLIDYHRFPGLSCNYLPPSHCNDLRIIYHNTDLLKDWSPDIGIVEVDNSDFEIDSSREIYKFSMDSITNEILPYEIDNKSHWLKIEIIHKPLLGNYPHCEFQLIASHTGGSVIENLTSTKKYHRALIANLRRLLELNSKQCE